MAIDRKLRKKLIDWGRAGLISPEQSEKILSFEENHAGAHGFLFMISWLAAACIVLGMIALIASNWEAIPAFLKLTLYFLIFGIVGRILLLSKTIKPLLDEILRLGLMIYSMAGIGLVAQIYHLHSQPWRGVAFWCLITFGLALSSSGPWGAVLWLPAALFAWFSFFNTLSLAQEWIAVLGIITVGSLGIFGSFHSRKLIHLIHFRHISFLFVTLACIAYSVTAAYQLDEKIHNREFFTFLAMALLWSATIWFQKAEYKFGSRMGMLVFLGLTTAQFPLQAIASSLHWDTIPFKIVSCAFFIAGTLALAIAAFAHDQKKVFEALCIFIFLRLLALYTESLMTLTAKGFGLISVGLLILGGLYAWTKLKPTIYAKLEGELNAKK
ncbi:MAG: DUF2157 domain-containing protein [Oligoflexus sp.]|nr:DUF2157 domain-containing protein [Oligoflexus sp.]